MARSVEEITKELTKLNQSSLDNSINTLNQTAESDRNIINTNADVSVSNITDAYNTQIADVKEGYNEAFNRNEVQKVLNERYLERKAAEIGLTDSGMNRTQMTANQLSHANQQGRLDAALQKDVNTLAAAMRAKITEVNTNRNNSLAQIDSTLNSNIAQLRSDFNSSINQQAVDIHNAEYEAEQEQNNKYTYRYDTDGNVVGRYTSDDRKTVLSNLNTFLEGSADDEAKLSQIYNFIRDYDGSELETLNLLEKAGLEYNDLAVFYDNIFDVSGNEQTGSLRVTPQKYNELYMAKNVGSAYVDLSDWNYKTNGTMRYNFTITKSTLNGGGKNTVDYNDRVSIAYPDGTPIKGAENIKIKDLPESIRRAITDRTAGKKKDDTFYYSCNLKDLDL